MINPEIIELLKKTTNDYTTREKEYEQKSHTYVSKDNACAIFIGRYLFVLLTVIFAFNSIIAIFNVIENRFDIYTIDSCKINNATIIIDGLDLNNSLFKRDELEFKKYFFNKVLIENHCCPIKVNKKEAKKMASLNES